MNKILLLLFLSFSIATQTHAQWTITPVKAYNGKIDNVTRVMFKRMLFGKKNRGVFVQTGKKNWTENATRGTFYWYELNRKNGRIVLIDTASSDKLEINMVDKQIGDVGPRGGVTGKYVITYAEETDPYTNRTTLYKVNGKQEWVEESSGYGGQTFTNKDDDDDKEDKGATAANPVQLTKETQNQLMPIGNQQPVVQTPPPPPPPTAVAETKVPEVEVPSLENSTPVYHAILIAENTYEDKSFNTLPGTLSDVRKMYYLLTTKYTFDPANVDTMVSSSKESILRRLNAVAKNLGENDNLLIFYAGHGWVKKYNDGSGRQEGFLIPSDAAKGEEVSFIDNQDITVILKRSNAKHILFVADACFAGALFRDLPNDAPASAAMAYKDKSRKLLSSGNEQAVSDESDFVEYLRLALQENRSKYMTTLDLLNGFRKDYVDKTHMQLQYVPLQNVDDRGGEFVFIRR